MPDSTDEEHLARKPHLVELTAGDVRDRRLPDLSWIHLLPPQFTDPPGGGTRRGPGPAATPTPRRGHLLAFRPGPNRVSDEYLDALAAFGFDE